MATNSLTTQSSTTHSTRRVAIVGAGLAGLSAAFRLQQQGCKVTIFESTAVVGGRVQSLRIDGFTIDTGASAVGENYQAYFALAAELGLSSEILPASPYIGIFREDRTHLLNLKRMIWSGLTTSLLSFWSKILLTRLVFDIALAVVRGQLNYADMRKAAPLDVESAQRYGLRVLNAEIDSYLSGPIVRTMVIADTDKISKVELFSGIANIFASRVFALRGGQGRLADELAKRLNVRLQQSVLEVAKVGHQVRVKTIDEHQKSAEDIYDACIVTCPLPSASAICVDQQALLDPIAKGLCYTKAITVALSTSKLPNSPAFLVQMPTCEDAEVALLFLEHNKAADRAPVGRGLIGCDWEAEASAKWFNETDEAIGRRSVECVLKVFPGLEGHIELIHVARWSHALPYTKVGSYQMIGNFNAGIDPCSPIQFAGDYMSEAGQNTAIEFGNKAADSVLRLFHTA